MRKSNVLKMLAFFVVGTTMMYGQATRTWVSGVGDDANPCSRTAPCKTFAGAISKTAPGGEMDALDPGGFGALTITKSITIDGGGGQVASILVAGTNGIVVAAGASDVVVIRNMRFDGLLGGGNANAGLSGIRFISGKALNIVNCFIMGFNNTGIDIELGASATVNIVNTVIENIGSCNPASCLTAQGDGIFATTTSGLVKVGISNSSVMQTSDNGIEAGSNSRVNVDHGFLSATGLCGLFSDGATGTSQMALDNSELVDGNNGVCASNSSTVNVSHTTIANNTGNAYNAIGGTVNAYTYINNGVATSGTNRVHDNGALGTPTYINEN